MSTDFQDPVMELWGVWSTLLLPLFPDPLWPGVLGPVRIPSMSKNDPFKSNLYSIELYANKQKTNILRKNYINNTIPQSLGIK